MAEETSWQNEKLKVSSSSWRLGEMVRGVRYRNAESKFDPPFRLKSTTAIPNSGRTLANNVKQFALYTLLILVCQVLYTRAVQ